MTNIEKQIEILRKEQKEVMAELIDERLHEIIQSNEGKEVLKRVRAFVDDFISVDPYIFIDECGSLAARIDLDLSVFSSDREVIEALAEYIENEYNVLLGNDSFATCYDQMYCEIGLGDYYILEPNPARNQYAISGTASDLRVESVLNKRHGLLLIEQDMRRNGYFPDIISVSYNGDFSGFVSTDLGRKTDAEIDAEIDKIEQELENE